MHGVIAVQEDARPDSSLCLVAAKVYKKIPNLLLSADSYHLPSLKYINDLVAEFPLSAHTLVSSLTALHNAPTKQMEPCVGSPADSHESVPSRAVTSEAPASAAADKPAGTVAPPANTAVSHVNTAVPPSTEDPSASAIPPDSSTPINYSFFDLTSTSRANFVVWPHPTPAAWKNIQTVALRAFVTLGWLGSSVVQARMDEQEQGPKSLCTKPTGMS